jgi:hypothetical protein
MIRKARNAFQFYLLEAGSRICAEAVDKRSAKQVHGLAFREWVALAVESRQKYIEIAVEDVQRVCREKQSCPRHWRRGTAVSEGSVNRILCAFRCLFL